MPVATREIAGALRMSDYCLNRRTFNFSLSQRFRAGSAMLRWRSVRLRRCQLRLDQTAPVWRAAGTTRCRVGRQGYRPRDSFLDILNRLRSAGCIDSPSFGIYSMASGSWERGGSRIDGDRRAALHQLQMARKLAFGFTNRLGTILNSKPDRSFRHPTLRKRNYHSLSRCNAFGTSRPIRDMRRKN